MVALAGYWYFIGGLKSSKSNIEKWIPSNSLMLVTINNLNETIKQYSRFNWWDETKSLPFINELVLANERVDSLVQGKVLHSRVNANPIFISLHSTSNNSIEPLIFIESKGFEWLPTNIKKLAALWVGEEMLFSTRVFNEKLIYEADGADWGFITVDNFLVLSTNAVLLEDVIRAEEGEDYRIFKEGHNIQAASSGVSFILNTARLNRLNAVFTNRRGNEKELDYLVNFSFEPQEDRWVLNGLSTTSDKSQLTEDLPSNASIKAENFIPSSATSIQWFGVENGKRETITGFDLDRFIQMQNSELCQVELDLGGESLTTVLLSEVDEKEETQRMLEKLAISSRSEGDTLFTETYLGQEIRFVDHEKLLSQIYGARFETIGKPYYAFFNNILLISDKIDGLKSVLADYDAENTWGKIPEKRRYLDNLIRESNITQLNNFEYYLDPLIYSFSPKWKEFFKKNNVFFASLENFNYQVNTTSDRLIISAALSFNESVEGNSKPQVAITKSESQLNLKVNAFSESKLITKPFVVKNHVNNSQEIIFQDDMNRLYLVDRSGNILWKKQMDGRINGAIEQVDFYDNKKLQLLMFTDSALHLIDRNGDEVEGFPKTFESELPVLHYSVVDYDNSKNYRYATGDRRGNIYLLDKEGQPLEGWSPKDLGFALRMAPEHVRIRGRDCFVIVQSNGTIHLINRRGEEYPGFPYQYPKRLVGDYFIRQGPSFAESFVKVLGEDGETISIDFNGKVKGRNQLLKPAVSSQFFAARDKLNTGLMVVRKDDNAFTFFDETGKRRFDKVVQNEGEWTFEYYNFRNDSELFVMQNLGNGDLIILDEAGTEKVNQPAFTNNPVALVYYQNRREYELFVNLENQMAIYTFAK